MVLEDSFNMDKWLGNWDAFRTLSWITYVKYPEQKQEKTKELLELVA
jgi:hypothetical protein